MYLVVIGGEISSKTEMASRDSDSSFLQTMCTVTTKQHNCPFLILKRNIQNETAGFAHFTVVETIHFIG